MEPILECRNIALADEGRVLYGDLSFGLNPGQGGLILSSPAGPARDLLRICATLDEPSQGAVSWFGRSLKDMGESTRLYFRRKIGWVHRRTSLVSNLSVLDNIILGAMYHRNLKRAEASAEVRDILDRFMLYDFRDRRPSELSFARQRLAVYVRELVKKPRLFLMEDAAVDLDKDFDVLMKEIKALADTKETAFLMADHAAEDVLGWADWVLVMDQDGHRMWSANRFDLKSHVKFPLGRGIIRDKGLAKQ